MRIHAHLDRHFSLAALGEALSLLPNPLKEEHGNAQ